MRYLGLRNTLLLFASNHQFFVDRVRGVYPHVSHDLLYLLWRNNSIGLNPIKYLCLQATKKTFTRIQ